MKVRIENGKSVTGQNGRTYWSFWVHVFEGALGLAVAGWKYFPDTKTVGTPGAMKGPGKFIHTVKPTVEMYNAVKDEAIRYFDSDTPSEATSSVEDDAA